MLLGDACSSAAKKKKGGGSLSFQTCEELKKYRVMGRDLLIKEVLGAVPTDCEGGREAVEAA